MTDTIVSVTAARASLPELLDRVLAGGEVTITRHGRPVAVVVRPDALRARRGSDAFESAAQVGRLLAAARAAPLDSAAGIEEERAEELIASVRAGRRTR